MYHKSFNHHKSIKNDVLTCEHMLTKAKTIALWANQATYFQYFMFSNIFDWIINIFMNPGFAEIAIKAIILSRRPLLQAGGHSNNVSNFYCFILSDFSSNILSMSSFPSFFFLKPFQSNGCRNNTVIFRSILSVDVCRNRCSISPKAHRPHLWPNEKMITELCGKSLPLSVYELCTLWVCECFTWICENFKFTKVFNL